MRLTLIICVVFMTAASAEKISFSEQIRPIFNRKCTGCHGGVKQHGGLSLLYKKYAFGKTEHGIGIVPGKPEESMLYKVITDPPEVIGKDGKKHKLELMPLEKEPLTEKEVKLIKTWIEQGAHWEEHWAYDSVSKHPVPEVKNKTENYIDNFVFKKLESIGLPPSKQASKGKLLRRLALDLTGLPPSQEDYKKFMADESPQAYEKMVDQYLASKHYGERWAAMWLDLARYADTQGYEKDNARTIWRFRDEVINAFNQDMTYDKFIINQMAGDLIKDATMQQKVLTAFHRNTMTNTEGGTNDEEFRVAAVIDRVNTTWDAFMGTSYGCVQCHTHPYDPFTHEEYFQFMAFLNNTADNDRNNEAPILKTPTSEELKRYDKLKAELEALNDELKKKSLKQAKTSSPKVGDNRILEFTSLKSRSGNKLTFTADKTVLTDKTDADTDVYTLTAPAGAGSLGYLKLDAIPHENFNNKSGIHGNGNFVLSEISVTIKSTTNKKDGDRKIKFVKSTANHEQKDFYIRDSINDSGKDKGWAVDGKLKQKNTAWISPAEPVDLKEGDLIEIKLSFQSKFKKHILGHFKVSIGNNIPHFLQSDPKIVKLNEKRTKLEKQISNFKFTTTPVMEELPEGKKRKTHVFNRGSWEDLAEEVKPGVPEILNEFKDEWPRNRLGMAYWMTDAKNPLTARVAVNRFWEQLFGIGIVETLEDFGSQGIKPTHPKLLDNLAWSFVHNHNWSMKELLKEIVMSATYKQSSDATEKHLEIDPFNKYLARAPRFRLSAEQLRDQALKISGLFKDKMFGPSVMPFQPKGVWMSVYNGRDWVNAKDGEQHRRALYTYWKRTSPYPSMETFDTPSREVCKVRRVRTNTPLQALVTLNDPAYVECAQAFAGQIVKYGGSDIESKVQYAYRKALGRTPREREVSTLIKLHKDCMTNFAKNEKQAWDVVAGIIMNLDEFLNRQ